MDISNENKDRLENYFDTCAKLDSFNWLRELSDNIDIPDIVALFAILYPNAIANAIASPSVTIT